MQLFKNKKPLKIKRLTRVSVPLKIPFSNSFYQNLIDIYGLKELINVSDISEKSSLHHENIGFNKDLILPNGH